MQTIDGLCKEIFSPNETKLLKTIFNFLYLKSQEVEIYPDPENIFRALNHLETAKVVILGQDPYHQPNQANGLAFAVNKGISPPPSLVNIFKELKEDLGEVQTDSTLLSWANQGVILLNSTLTVERNRPNSHYELGWYKLTNKIIQWLSNNKDHLVFILWGKKAQEKESLINLEKHQILKSTHPSPLSAYQGFFGSKPFSKTNTILKEWSYAPIIW